MVLNQDCVRVGPSCGGGMVFAGICYNVYPKAMYFTQKESIGIIAHELQEHFPFLVEGTKDGPQTQTVNYIGLIGVLIKEVQELKNRVHALETK